MTSPTSRARLGLLIVLTLCLSSATVVAESIGLPRPVPSFNQAYNDGPGAWANCTLGTGGCPDTIGTTGCLVTALASALAYHEIEVSVPARASCTGRARTGMDPGVLNDWLRSHDGYGHCSLDPAGNCCLAWDRLPPGIELTSHTNRNDVGISSATAVVLDHALRQGNPIIAGVHWSEFCRSGSSQSEDCHWVVIIGKIGEIYTILDPYNPDPKSPTGVRTTLDAGVKGSYIIDRFVVVSRASPSIEDAVLADGSSGTAEGGEANAVVVLLVALVVVAAIIALVTSLRP